MRYVALFSFLFLMTISLYAENQKLIQVGPSVCQPDEYIPFLPPVFCKKHNLVEQSSQNGCFNLEHFASGKLQCRKTSKLKIFDPQMEAHYQAGQNKFSTIEF